ncbi:hypothetical protein SAMN05661096_00099 [Marivirga sericea]|uniref:Apea-like HEPN domain-containing protein n=1 Tax=Marivirga sericea TaxID=1028 RepID=A0A1X7I1E0_9BACT|nr:hypothetical protein [Marivirga sericea]SMG07944.1 hypothetical protein SAMN05661096_00099 [Marivirga sericea]
MKEINLIGHFKIPGISERDLLTYFQQGDAHTENGTYFFLADQIKVEFNNKEHIKSIMGSLDSIFVKRALSDLREIAKESDLEIGRVVVQGVSPLTSYYRYKDLIQICPLKSKPQHLASGRSKFPFPFLLEFKYRTSKNNGIRNQRMQQAKENAILILNLLLYGGITDVNATSNDTLWVSVPTDWRDPTDEEIEMFCDYKHPTSMNRTNMYLNPSFGLDEKDVNYDSFANVEGLKSIELIDFKKYYQRLGVGSDDEINLPSIVDINLDKYFSIENKTKINRALYWLLKHHETWKVSKSISFNCLIQSIEVLMETQKNTAPCKENNCEHTKILNDICEKCEDPITGIGPTKAFRDFVEKYAGDIPKKIKDNLYGLRSSIAHGSLTLEMDSASFGGFDAKSHNQRHLMDIGREIVVVCLLNWMMKEN